MASSMGNRMSREDFRLSKELEELRKTGAAPPELDEDGKMINPHIPQYISVSPWYLQNNRPGLKHQYVKAFSEKKKFADITQFYSRGQLHASGNKFRDKACPNCGAATHKQKECTERPRRRGAKLTGTDFAPDEVIQELAFDYEGKHDRWRGYDPAEYQSIITLNQKAEEERKKKKMEEISKKHNEEAVSSKKIQKKKAKVERKKAKEAKKAKKAEKKAAKANGAAGDDSNDSSDSDTETEGESDTDSDTDEEDEDDDLADVGKVISLRQDREKYTTNRTTARDLRIREDTAKYLRNLNVNSAHYDPKTRSMRENPYPEKDANDLMYAGDNYLRRSGDALVVQQVQNFVMAANDRGSEVNLLTNPSEAEHLFDQFKKKKEQLKTTRQQEILERYGGKEHLDQLPDELRFAQSETYVEYNEIGDVVKGQEKAIPRTKYLEDVHEHGHSEVWGSLYKDGKWGYACCGNFLRAAFCTGESGRKALTNGSSSSSTTPSLLMPPPASPAPSSLISAANETHVSADRLQAARLQQQLSSSSIPADNMETEDKSASSVTIQNGDDDDKDGGGGGGGGLKKKNNKLSAEKLKAREARKAERAARKEAKQKAKAERGGGKKRKRGYEEEPEDENTKQIKEALAEERKRLSDRTGDIADKNVHKNKGGYNVVKTDLIPTEQEMEAYHRLKSNPEDPMNNYIDPE